ncbi:cytosine/adenosine deaminase-related metal-dependent hydrolase [Microbacterium foliorum]|uniref:Cytosine/adenosine deaminase-related metal-dependent hydrolase n=1 Tax=Microbacterium foliorum TaxID=104336 RepID=A0ABU1HVG3_9MICO|nr:amidohydrolase family protein [Microbacterium foliorum]MDR6144031.1 cytosine/adenosine deaminase-related metal-dependent hydrolase [Microbacterium foliorum]
MNIVHGAGLTPDWVRILVDAGVSFTSTPENELGQGHADPLTAQLLLLGTAPSLGTDTDCVTDGDIRVAARIALAFQRGSQHNTHRHAAGIFAPTNTVTSRQALEWATVRGAHALGLGDRIGHLAAGMHADLVVIDPRTITLWPGRNPIATALNAHPGAVDAVMVDGQWRKQHGALTRNDIPAVLTDLARSSDRIAAALDTSSLLHRARGRVVGMIATHKVNLELTDPTLTDPARADPVPVSGAKAR